MTRIQNWQIKEFFCVSRTEDGDYRFKLITKNEKLVPQRVEYRMMLNQIDYDAQKRLYNYYREAQLAPKIKHVPVDKNLIKRMTLRRALGLPPRFIKVQRPVLGYDVIRAKDENILLPGTIYEYKGSSSFLGYPCISYVSRYNEGYWTEFRADDFWTLYMNFSVVDCKVSRNGEKL